MICFKNVTYSINNRIILENISFIINNREKVLIIGESGSGKSTILNLLVGNIKPTRGNIYYNEESILEYNTNSLTKLRKEKIRFILQDDDLFSYLTVNENLLLYYYQRSIDEILKKASLYHLKNRKVETLSGGERQRISIIKSCLSNCEILLCDEITSALDDKTAISFINFILNLFENKTIIFISHNKDIFKDKIHQLIEVKNKGISTTIYKEVEKKSKLDIKVKNKTFKSILLSLSFKKLSLYSLIIFILTMLCLYIFIDYKNIFSNITNSSRLNYYDYNVYQVINNDDLEANNEDIFYDFSDEFDNIITNINDSSYRFIQYKPFYKENDSSIFVLSSSLANSFNIEKVYKVSIIFNFKEIVDDNPKIVIENNMYSTSCIYYNYLALKKYLDKNYYNDNLIYIDEDIEFDNRFDDNPLFTNIETTKPYLENNSYYEYLTYSMVFDSLTSLIYYFSLLILIYAFISNILIYLSSFIQDIKKIAILIFRGVKYNSLILSYFLNNLIYGLVSLFLLFLIDYKTYFISLLINLFINYLAINLSFVYVKKSKLNDLLKEDILC